MSMRASELFMWAGLAQERRGDRLRDHIEVLGGLLSRDTGEHLISRIASLYGTERKPDEQEEAAKRAIDEEIARKWPKFADQKTRRRIMGVIGSKSVRGLFLAAGR